MGGRVLYTRDLFLPLPGQSVLQDCRSHAGRSVSRLLDGRRFLGRTGAELTRQDLAGAGSELGDARPEWTRSRAQPLVHRSTPPRHHAALALVAQGRLDRPLAFGV